MTVNQTLASRTETSLTISWNADYVVDRLWYSTDGGSHWSAAITVSEPSGSYTITRRTDNNAALSAGTTYQIVTSLRNKVTGSYTNSSTASWATYNYPYCNSAPDFTIGASLKIGLYNPLGRAVTITMSSGGLTKTAGGTYTGKSVSGFNSDQWIDWWYQTIPSATRGQYSVTVTYDGHSSTGVGGYYSIVPADCSPTAGALTYQDTNISAVHITGDNQKIIQLMSTVEFTAPDVQAKKHATISMVSVQINGVGYALQRVGTSNVYKATDITLNYTSDVEAQLIVVDSRGLAMAMAPITISMVPYSTPTAIISLARRFNYYSETYLRVDASYSSLNGGNSITIKYRSKQAGGAWEGFTTISNRQQYTIQLDNLYDWTVQVVIEDSLGATVTYNVPLAKGMPIVFFDALRSSMGINCFPESDDSLWVNGNEWIPQNFGYHDFDLGSGAQTVTSARYLLLLSASDVNAYLPAGCVWIKAEPIRWNTATGVFNINIYGDGSVYLIMENSKSVSNLKIRCFFAKCVQV